MSQDPEKASAAEVLWQRSQEVAETVVQWTLSLEALVKDWDETTILAVASDLEANEGCVGFRSKRLDCAADILRGEVGHRRLLAEARAAGVRCYCGTCKGECKGPEEHDRLRAEPRHTPRELEIMAMSRRKLIELCLKLEKEPL